MSGKYAEFIEHEVLPLAEKAAHGFRSAEDTYRNWPLANNRMAEALKAKGYAYQYVWAQDAGHVERGVERQTLEEAIEWVWKRE